MQALILAAGFGKRLQPITNTIPKSLVEVNGTPLLVNALDHLSGRTIDEVVIVVGHKKEKIMDRIGHMYQGMKITYVENPDYDRTNNIYSFYLARNYIHDDVIMLECDLFYQRELIDKIVDTTADCNILVSPFNPETMDGTVIEPGDDGKARALSVNRMQGPDFCFNGKLKTINIYKFKKEFIVNKFFPMLKTYMHLYDKNSYYELVLGILIYLRNDDFQIVPIDESKWCEIDDRDDLKRANIQFAEL